MELLTPLFVEDVSHPANRKVFDKVADMAVAEINVSFSYKSQLPNNDLHMSNRIGEPVRFGAAIILDDPVQARAALRVFQDDFPWLCYKISGTK